ncbi:transposase [Vibrio cholerae]|uniref:IS66 family insertion sequence element accessory protein TnpA n=2 Tax=Vibrio cholerae TaxID=666 RepID=UPI00208AE96E|nr:transposase [Vibrio cholerae]
MAKRYTNQEWRTLFEHYESSQLSQRLFCERNGLSLSTFYAKRQQLKYIEKPNTLALLKQTSLKSPRGIKPPTLTLIVNDVELSIPQDTPVTYLAELIGALS